MREPNNQQKTQMTFRELVLATVVILNLLGLMFFSFIDESTRPVFLDVAKLSIGIYMGYLIPNQN